MAEDLKKKQPEQLQDEQLNEVAGGIFIPTSSRWDEYVEKLNG